jgi:hypothetical protein
MRTLAALAPVICASLAALCGCAVGTRPPQTQAELAAGPPREPPAATAAPAACTGEMTTPACAAAPTLHGAAAADTDDEWVDGYWHYNGTRYVWMPGRWQKRRPAYTWAPR